MLIMHTRCINAGAHFQQAHVHVFDSFARVSAQIFHGGPLLFCAVRFFLASTVYESQLETEADEVETGSKTKCLALLCKQHPWEAPSSFVNL